MRVPIRTRAGPIPVELAQLKYLIEINLANNRLSGELFIWPLRARDFHKGNGFVRPTCVTIAAEYFGLLIFETWCEVQPKSRSVMPLQTHTFLLRGCGRLQEYVFSQSRGHAFMLQSPNENLLLGVVCCVLRLLVDAVQEHQCSPLSHVNVARCFAQWNTSLYSVLTSC